jgi:hypothetical protein
MAGDVVRHAASRQGSAVEAVRGCRWAAGRTAMASARAKRRVGALAISGGAVGIMAGGVARSAAP